MTIFFKAGGGDWYFYFLIYDFELLFFWKGRLFKKKKLYDLQKFKTEKKEMYILCDFGSWPS